MGILLFFCSLLLLSCSWGMAGLRRGFKWLKAIFWRLGLLVLAAAFAVWSRGGLAAVSSMGWNEWKGRLAYTASYVVIFLILSGVVRFVSSRRIRTIARRLRRRYSNVIAKVLRRNESVEAFIPAVWLSGGPLSRLSGAEGLLVLTDTRLLFVSEHPLPLRAVPLVWFASLDSIRTSRAYEPLLSPGELVLEVLFRNGSLTRLRIPALKPGLRFGETFDRLARSSRDEVEVEYGGRGVVHLCSVCGGDAGEGSACWRCRSCGAVCRGGLLASFFPLVVRIAVAAALACAGWWMLPFDFPRAVGAAHGRLLVLAPSRLLSYSFSKGTLSPTPFSVHACRIPGRTRIIRLQGAAGIRGVTARRRRAAFVAVASDGTVWTLGSDARILSTASLSKGGRVCDAALLDGGLIEWIERSKGDAESLHVRLSRASGAGVSMSALFPAGHGWRFVRGHGALLVGVGGDSLLLCRLPRAWWRKISAGGTLETEHRRILLKGGRDVALEAFWLKGSLLLCRRETGEGDAGLDCYLLRWPHLLLDRTIGSPAPARIDSACSVDGVPVVWDGLDGRLWIFDRRSAGFEPVRLRVPLGPFLGERSIHGLWTVGSWLTAVAKWSWLLAVLLGMLVSGMIALDRGEARRYAL